MRRRRVARAGLVGLLLALVGLAPTPVAQASVRSHGPEADYATSLVRQRLELVDGSRTANRLIDLLPNRIYETPSGEGGSVSDLVVRGQFASVEPGRGFRTDLPDGAESIEQDFDDPTNQWVTVRITIDVEEVIAGDPAGARQVVAGLALGPDVDLERFRQSLLSIDEVIAFLSGDSPVFAYDPGLLAIGGNGGYVATIEDQGRLELPFLDRNSAETLLQDQPTLDTLRAAAQEQPQVIQAGGPSPMTTTTTTTTPAQPSTDPPSAPTTSDPEAQPAVPRTAEATFTG